MGQKFHEIKSIWSKSFIKYPWIACLYAYTSRLSYLEIKSQQKALASLNKGPQ